VAGGTWALVAGGTFIRKRVANVLALHHPSFQDYSYFR
jgi:hypothetical protein